MNYPSLSLEKKQIDDAFGIHQHPSPGRTNIVLKSISSKFLPNQTNQCEQCEYKTSKYNSMYSHMRVKHTDLRIKCTECNFSHPFQTKVNTHFKQVHLGQKRPDHRSDICRKRTCSKFYTKNCTELESHAALSCDKCNYSTARSDYLKFHIESVHDGIIYKCEYCPSYTAYKRKRALTEHILHKHSKTLFTCSDQECKFETQYKQTLKMHTESKHEGVVRYKCDSMNCSYKTNDSKCLKEHSLRDHLKKHSGEKPNKCNQCDYASIRASTLRDHLKKHSGEKSNKCNQCDYASSRADSLRRHLRTHSGEKTKKCNQCEYACSDPSSLRRHLKTHSGEKSNKCNQSDFASSRAASLRDHLKKHSFSLGTT